MNTDTCTLRRLRRSRRLLAAALAASTATLPFSAWLAHAQAPAAIAADSLTLTPAQLQSAAEPAFPRKEAWLGGLARLTLSRPVIAIPAGGNRIQMDLDYDASLAGSGSHQGRFRVASGLRYDPATRGLHLERPELLELRDGNPGKPMDAQTREMVNSLLEQYAQDEPIYRLDADTLAQIPGTLSADAIRIQDGQVHVRLGQ